MDNWNPKQYEKFKDQRAKPFWDLLALVKPTSSARVIDLGCGTGELTRSLHEKLNATATIGIDSSEKMLKQSSAFESPGLKFEKADIGEVAGATYDVVFSNAALQWLPNHEELFPKVLALCAPNAQVAIQMPYNMDHPSHRIADEVAAETFPEFFPREKACATVLGVERYAEILFAHGFAEQDCSIRVYGHPMPSGRDVIEWTKGTLLTRYQSRLAPVDFDKFLQVYSQRLLTEIGEGPYFYGFKRMLLWGQR